MSNTFILSDTHFSHKAEFLLKNRGFSSVEEMDSILINNWNNVVSDNDTVFHLGDVVFQPATRTDIVLPQLKGKKVLIMGNHDRGKYLSKYFDDFYSILEYDIFIFSHIPLNYTELRGRFLGKINVHGHIHNGNSSYVDNPFTSINVNCEFINYKPIKLNDLAKTLQKRDNTLILVRGLPGSGKTTFSKKFKDESTERFMHFEADQYFYDENNVYDFNYEELEYAHQYCYTNTADMLINNESVIVSNTFTTLKEMSSYIHLSERLGTKLKVIKCIGDFGSIHNVPESTLDKMKNRWENYSKEIIYDHVKGELHG